MIEIYADGASLDDIIKLNNNPDIAGFTTNPSLMKREGVTNYIEFVERILTAGITIKPISFEVFADDYENMKRQAFVLSNLSENIYVKIPITNTKGESNCPLMKELSLSKVKINATAIFTCEQIDEATRALDTETPSIISVFAGRIADAGVNPKEYIEYASFRKRRLQKILWASTREVYNYVQAQESKADIITISPEILNKMFKFKRMNLREISLDTVRMFYNDALESGYEI